MVKLLHFADAHIDMANYGRHDPQSGLPMRVVDFLKSLDVIIDTAIQERVDLVIFAGDAFKDRTPAPTYQREWGRRLMRLSMAGIPTLLLVGNHDLAPALGRAHALESFDTLQVPHVVVLDKPEFLSPQRLEGLPVQVLALPWISRSGLIAALGMSASDTQEVFQAIEERLTELVHKWLDERDESLPVILTAHCSVQGAKYGGERTVMLGADLVLPGSLVKDSRLDYVALGHIHKRQDLNEGAHPPVVYPGSIERVDFGEAADDKFFVVAHVARNHTVVEWRKLEGIRPFIDCSVNLESEAGVTEKLKSALPSQAAMRDAIVRLVVDYPRRLEPMIDEASLRDYAGQAFEFHLVKRPLVDGRIRLPGDLAVGSLTSMQLLEMYLSANHTDQLEVEALRNLAETILHKHEP